MNDKLTVRALTLFSPQRVLHRLRDRLQFAAVWILLGLARALILIAPRGSVARLLGADRPDTASTVGVLSEAQLWRIAKLGRVVRTAADQTPWASECYPQALVARFLLVLRRIPHEVSFGLLRDGDELKAHVWVRAGGYEVTGGDPHHYTEVSHSTWMPGRSAEG